MSEENRTPSRQFVEIGDIHHSVDSAGKGEGNLKSQLLDRGMSTSEVDMGVKAIIACLATQFETLIQSVRELSERSSKRLREGNI